MKILQLNIEAYGGCNFKCQMCPQSPKMGGRERTFLKKLPFSVFTKVVEDAMQYGLKSVSFHGSGEPTLHPELEQMITFAHDRGLYTSFFTNGLRLDGKRFEKFMRAGLSLATVSIVGADRETYLKWMYRDSFDVILSNLRECVTIMNCYPNREGFRTRHLITDPSRKEEEIREYIEHIVSPLDCSAEIWMPHNWTGQYATKYDRFAHTSKQLRSCGRPFAATLEVRAGGLDGHFGAVVACPFVLGKDSQAVLGHLDTQSIAEVMSGQPLMQLQAAHREGRFDDISYCKGCDMLVDDQEVLAWSNVPGRYVGQSMTSDVDYPASFVTP